MSSLNVIPTARPDHPSLDYDLLRSEGIRHLENLATELWTDFNAHDPGITLLEVLCYAITDLGYRSRKLHIGDLLAGGEGKTFFDADEVLPMPPVTARDFRKLMIDVKGVKNAWIEKHTDPTLFTDKNGQAHVLYLPEGQVIRFKKIAVQTPDGQWQPDPKALLEFLQHFIQKQKNETDDDHAKRLKAAFEQTAKWITEGLTAESAKANPALAEALLCRFGYVPLAQGPAPADAGKVLLLNGLARIVLDLEDHIDPDNPVQTQPVVTRVMERLQANRFLCHDYVEPPVIVGKKRVAVCLHIEVGPNAKPLDAAVEALWSMEQHLSPRLRFRTYRQMRARGYCNDEILNGPLLMHGFLDNAEVDAARLPIEVRHSDLISAATTHPDVLCVHELKVKVYPGEAFEEKTAYPIYSPPERPLKAVLDLCASCIYVSHNGVRCELSESALKEALRLRRKQALCMDDPGGPEAPCGTAPEGLGDYRSLQYDLPEVYGVGQYGLSDDATPYQKGVCKQLQAFLALFDQLLASYLLHLEQVRDLMAVEQDPTAPTYFSADLSAVPGMSDILDPDLLAQFAPESVATRHDRRNRLLDHLLARFGEAFTEYALGLLCSGDDTPGEDFTEYLQAKAQFLREVATLSADRGKGYNYRQKPVWNTDNVAGVKKRVHRILGLKGHWGSGSLLTSPPYRLDIQTVYKTGGAAQYQIAFRDLGATANPDDDASLMRSKRFNSPKMAKDRRDQLYSDIWRKELYSVGPHPTETDRFAVLFSVKGTVELFSPPGSEQEAHDLMEHVLALVGFAPDAEKEGFHVLEHLLLRPNDPADSLLCLPLNCDPEHLVADPYSNWVTVVAPNWPPRFANARFRIRFEQHFRRELPAEDAVRFCWVDKEQMRAFEERYMAWLEAKADCMPDECHVTAAANALIEWLNTTPCSCLCHHCCHTESACDDCKEC